MSRPFLNNIDLNKNELQNARVQNLASAPAAPAVGQIYFDTSLQKLRYNSSSGWINADGSDIPDGTITSAKIADLTIVDGDISATAAIALSKLAVNPLARANHTGTQASSTITAAATDRLLGRDTAGSGAVEELTVSGGIEFSGTGGIRTGAFTGEVTKAAGGTALTIANDAVVTAKILNDAVTNPKLANMATGTIKGRSTAGTGDPEDLSAAQVKSLLAIVPGDVAGFDTQVRTSRLDQMAAPNAALSMNGQKLTAVGTPTADTDAANKAYVDATVQGMDWKGSVRVATTGDITLSGTQSIDGVAVVAGNRVLVKNQSSGTSNGIYVVAAGAWARAGDADSSADVNAGMVVPVEEGTENGDRAFILTTNDPITLGTTPLTFTQLPGAQTAYAGGAGLTLTGSTFDVGAGTGISVESDTVSIDTAVVARKFTQVLATSATAYTVTHGLGNQWVTVQVFENSGSFRQVEVDVELTDANNVTVRFAVAPTANAYRVVVTG